MKKLFLSTFGFSMIISANAQFNTNWPAPANSTNTSNSTSSGYVGLGIRALASSTNLPSFNFQVHGVNDLIVTIPAGRDGSPGGTINYGKTARIGLTNTTTGLTSADGGVLRMSGTNLALENLEQGNILISNGLTTTFHGAHGKVYVGTYSNYAVGASQLDLLARLNIQGTDNGLYIRTQSAGKYGVTIQMQGETDNAINVYPSQSSTVANFRVKGSGEVYARKYITTLAAFPDYVFNDDYKLLTFSELRTYLSLNNRLPNMPSAIQVAEEGADLGELNRLLVEKVEELTLYILQLEKRTKLLETIVQDNK